MLVKNILNSLSTTLLMLLSSAILSDQLSYKLTRIDYLLLAIIFIVLLDRKK
jgi:hypothetical protein